MKTPKCQCARCKLYMRAVHPDDPDYDIFEDDGVTRKCTNFEVRDYQTALIEIAKKQNIIACLPTGSGKTFIAFKLIEHFREDLLDFQQRKKVIFLANTIPLVTQQAEFLARNSLLGVKHLTGDMEVDYWSDDKWDNVVGKFEILAMTTQIFLNALRHSFIKFSQIALIIFDECHHAVKDHPMKHVMQKYHEAKDREPNYPLPRILGMTATIVKGNCSQFEVPDRVVELEKTMNAKAVTYKDYENVLKHSTSSRVKTFCIESDFQTEYWKDLYRLDELEEYNKQLNKLRKENKKLKAISSINNVHPTLTSVENIFLSLKQATAGDLKIAVEDVRYSCANLGPYCGVLAINLKLAFIEFSLMDLTNKIMKEWYIKVRDIFIQIKSSLETLMASTSNEDKITRFTTKKVQKLLEVLKTQFGQDEEPTCLFNDDAGICGIIFVDRRVTAQVLSWYLKDLASIRKDYEFIRANFVVGTSAAPFETVETKIYSKKQTETIEGFRTKKYNLLVATSVLEEGIDVPSCNIIVRFDRVQTFTSYIQSMGRARKPNALFCALIDSKEYMKEAGDLEEYSRINNAMIQYLIKNVEKIDEIPGAMEYEHNIKPFCPGNTADSPSVSLDDAMDVVDLYCRLLPCDGISTLQTLSWWIPAQNEVGKFTAYLKLPMNSVMKSEVTVGIPMRSQALARQAVHFTAAKRLYELGALDDKLLAVRPSIPDQIDVFFKGLTSSSNPDESEEGEIIEKFPISKPVVRNSTTEEKRSNAKEVHSEWYPKRVPKLFESGVIEAEKRYTVYRIVFDLIEKKENYPWKNLFNFKEKRHCFGLIVPGEMPNIGSFPLYGGFGVISASLELIPDYTILLKENRLDEAKEFSDYLFRDILGLNHKLLALKGNVQLLILPLYLFEEDKYNKKGWKVDLDVIKNIKSFEAAKRPKRPNEAIRRSRSSDLSRSQYKNRFEEKVLVPWYKKGPNKAIYVVDTVEENMSPLSKFHDGLHSTYKEFIQEQYKTTVHDNSQPVLKTKIIGFGEGKNQLNYLLEKYSKEDEFPVYLLPELVHILPLSASIVIQLKFLPSFLHRLNRLLIAREILMDISHVCNWPGILIVPAEVSNMDTSSDDLNRLTAEHEEKRLAEIKRRQAYQDKLKKDTKPIPKTPGIEEREIHYEFIHPNKITKQDILLFHEAVSLQHAAKKMTKDIDVALIADAEFNESKIELTAMENIVLKKLEPEAEVDLNTFCGPTPLAIMEALTIFKSNEGVSNLRLHKIGWSFLNYVTSTRTYMAFPGWTEPLMCQLRNRVLTIKFLSAIAKRKNLEQVLSSSDFHPNDTWLPPGFELIYAASDLGELTAQHKVPLQVFDDLKVEEIKKMNKNALEQYVVTHAPDIYNKRKQFKDAADVPGNSKDKPKRRVIGKKQPSIGWTYSSYTHAEVSDVELAEGLCAFIGAFFIKCGTPGALEALKWLGFTLPDLMGQEQPVDSVKPLVSMSHVLDFTNHEEHFRRLLPKAAELEDKIQYKFENKRYLVEALTHPSYMANEITECYQRLEFLGDAILDVLLTNHIFGMTIKKDSSEKYTTLELCEIRAALVNNITYASLAVRYDLHKHLLSHSKDLLNMIDNFVIHQQAVDHHVIGHFTLVSDEEVWGPKHWEVPKVLGDIFEALAGAIYIDSGASLDTVWNVFYRLMENEIDIFSTTIPKSPLQELYHEFPDQVTFTNWTSKKIHERGRETMKITVGPHGSYYGSGTNKTRAREAASKIALKMIKEEDLFIKDRDATKIMMMC